MSKSRLEIPEDMLPLIKHEFARRNGEIIDSNIDGNKEVYSLMSHWFTTIKEPLTKEEYFESLNVEFEYSEYVFCGWKAALENQALKDKIQLESIKGKIIEKLANNGTLPTSMESFLGTIKDTFQIIEGQWHQ